MKDHTANSPISYCLFNTSIGAIGIAWSDVGIVSLQLPEGSEKDTRHRLIHRMARSTLAHATEVKPTNPWVKDTIKKIQEHLKGTPQNFEDVPLDLSTTSQFYCRVYQAARTIAPGQIKTYGEIAKQIRAPRAARAVGQALGKNPIALIVPCHRVVGANNKPGGFSAFGGLSTKEKLLRTEGSVRARHIEF